MRQSALPGHSLARCLPVRSFAESRGDPLKAMPTDKAWLGSNHSAAKPFPLRNLRATAQGAWLPNEAIAKAWMEYVKDTKVTDTTPPPAPTKVRLRGNKLTWEAEADVESGLAGFIIERDGKFLAKRPEKARTRSADRSFRTCSTATRPRSPSCRCRYIDTKAESGKKHIYRVIAVNTVSLK